MLTNNPANGASIPPIRAMAEAKPIPTLLQTEMWVKVRCEIHVYVVLFMVLVNVKC